MKKLSMIVFAAALATVFAGGCATGEAEKKEAAAPPVAPDPCVPAEREAEAKEAAEKIALGMAEALRSGDFEKFNAVQPKQGRGMPAGVFGKRRAALSRIFGNLVGVEYFGRLDQGQVNDYLWKFIYESEKKDAAPARREIIFWVRVGFAGGKPRVAGFSFDLH